MLNKENSKNGVKKCLKNGAFTLVETVIAITFITVVLTSVSGLILMTMSANQRNIHDLQAMELAQEGVEVMRFVRDSNWLQNYAWDGGSGEWRSDFALTDDDAGDLVTLYLTQNGCLHQWCFSSSEADGVVTTDKGFDFNRVIEVTHVLDNDGMVVDGAVKVACRVNWTDYKIPRSYELSTYLTDWQ